MDKHRLIPVAQIERVSAALEELPEKQPTALKKGEAVRKLVAQLSQAKSKGYTLEDLAVVLLENGIEMTPQALRSHISRAQRKSRRKRKDAASGEQNEGQDAAQSQSAGMA